MVESGHGVSPEEALEEMITECHPETLSEALQMINQFLTSTEESNDWKTEFLQQNTDIYFPNMELNTLEWLNNVRMSLEKVLNLE